MPFQVDANAAYTRHDVEHLRRLDDFDLLLIEQPLPEDDLLGHAGLAEAIATPVCLDESITSATVAADAIELGAAEIVNIKPGRVGGYLAARRIHDLCRDRGDPGLVRGDARDRHRAGRQRRPRRPRRVHAARRHLGVTAVLGRRHRHRTRSTSSTATSPCRTVRVSASSSTSTCSARVTASIVDLRAFAAAH